MTDQYIKLYGDISNRLHEAAKYDHSLDGIDRLVDLASIYEEEGHKKEIVVEFSESQSFAAIRTVKKIIDEAAEEAGFKVTYKNLSGKIYEAS